MSLRSPERKGGGQHEIDDHLVVAKANGGEVDGSELDASHGQENFHAMLTHGEQANIGEKRAWRADIRSLPEN